MHTSNFKQTLQHVNYTERSTSNFSDAFKKINENNLNNQSTFRNANNNINNN